MQNLRKDSGLKVEDRICVGIECSDDIATAINTHQLYFMNEVLGVKLDFENTGLKYSNSVKIDGELTTIGISLAN